MVVIFGGEERPLDKRNFGFNQNEASKVSRDEKAGSCDCVKAQPFGIVLQNAKHCFMVGFSFFQKRRPFLECHKGLPANAQGLI